MTSSVAVFQPGFRVTDANDLPVSGATISFYGAGTTTPKTIYSDYNLLVAIGTSVVTDSGGYPTSGGNKVLVYVDTAPFKVICTDSLGNVVWSHDNVQGAISGSTSSSVTSATATYGMAVGDVKLSVASSPDTGFVRLAETATALTKASYPDLNAWASAQGYPWGSTSTTFSVPPAAGYFLRFAGSSSSVDPDGPRSPGSTQTDLVKSHTHTASVSDPGHTHGGVDTGATGTNASAGGGIAGVANSSGTTATGYTGISVSITSTGGAENRAKNVAMHADMLATPALIANGLIGATGPVWQYTSGTNPASYTAGQFGFNNATPASGTTLYIHETDYPNRALANGNMASLLQSLPSSTRLYAVKVGDPKTQIVITTSGTATDAGTYDSFTVTVTTNGTISNNDLFTLVPLLPGPAGTDAVQPGYAYTFDTSTTMAAPASGAMRINSGTYSAATAIVFNVNSVDSGAPDITAWLDTLDDSTTTGDRARIFIRKRSAPGTFVEFKVTGANTNLTGARQLAVSYVTGSGTFSASDVVIVIAHVTGSAGAGNVSAASSFSADNRVLRSDGTGTNIQDSAITVDDTGNIAFPSYQELTEIVKPSSPASGKLRVYAKSDDKLYTLNSAGTETALGAGGGGGGGNATYINNLTLVPSVSGNALTIAVKTAAGADPAGDISITFRSSTATSGSYSTNSVSGALSITVPSGQAMGTSNNVPFRYWVLAIDNAGTTEIAVVNCVVGAATPSRVISLNESDFITTTAIASAPSAAVFYSTTARTAVAYRILGYVEYSSGLATAGTYGSAPTKAHVYSAGTKKPGDVVQTLMATPVTVQASTTSTSFTDTTTTQAITPTSAINIIKATASGPMGCLNSSSVGHFTLARGTTAFGSEQVLYSAGGQILSAAAIVGFDAPQTTSSTTYKVRFKADSGTVQYPALSGTGSSQLMLEEIMV